MAAEISQATAAEIPEIAPRDWRVGRMVRAHLAWSDPQIPVDPGRDRWRFSGTARQLLVPPIRPHPRVHLPHRANRPVPDPLARQADADVGVPNIAHLRGDAQGLGHLSDLARLPHVVCEWLLAEHMFASSHSDDRYVGMQVVRRGTKNGIDGRFLLQHDAEVFIFRAAVVGSLLGVVLLNFRTHRFAPTKILVVKRVQAELLNWIGDRDHLGIRLLEQRTHVGPSLATGTHQCDVHFVAGRHVPRTTQHVWSDNRGGHGGGGGLQKSSARCLHRIHLVSC